jgi:hypothetical protein
MRVSVIIILFNLGGYSAFAQITYEKGYFITSVGARTECLIKNFDWKNNPTEFQYRTEGTENQTMPVLQVQEFGIYGQSKYKTIRVNIDRSVFILTGPSTKNPVFKKETLALKVLVEGTADLYYYEDNAVVRFFFNVQDTAVEQLVYKEYLVDAERIAKNEQFKQQLWTRVSCGYVSEATVKKLRYDKNSLTNYFQKFNQCSGDAETQQTRSRKKNTFIKLTPGIGLATLTVEYLNERPRYNKEFSNTVSYHLGVEAEFMLPFNKNKWSLLIEPSYNTFTGSDGNDVWGNDAKNNTFEIALGVRHYFFLNKNSKIFLNGMLMCYVPLEESIQYLNLQAATNFGGALGAGYGYRRASIEMRHYINHETLANYVSWSGKQMKSIIVLGYRNT